MLARLTSSRSMAVWTFRSSSPGKAPSRVRLLWNFDDGEQSSPKLSIRYDDVYAPGYTERDYVLQRTVSSLPFSCDSAINYRFTTEGTKIALYKVGAE